MYAVIKTGGKQYQVKEGDVLYIEKLQQETGEITFSEVLLVGTDEELFVGKPTLSSWKVTADIEKTGRGKKIIVFTYKPKKSVKRKQGHRQSYTKIKITSIAKAS
ncbi:MAG: 50S ribosomal protein L21 [Oscillospiraceae bacterium]|jgi:large subunit ribosomal protein L21|nr:50S ribosomal protein L21 [Oscillospiraceae bacterium]